MTRFAWLQSRTQTLIVTGALAALAIVAVITGVHLTHLYNDTVAHCQSNCDLAVSQFLSHDRFLSHALDLVALLVPALFGVFWGAPLLARELESGSFRLAWTQSVTRTRWLTTKLALGAVVTVVLAGLLTLTITWWYRPVDLLSTNQFAVFERRDIAPIGYALFAFTAGALIGAFLRRSVPAMATTLGVYAFVRVATSLWVRPHLMPPNHQTVSLLETDRFGFNSSHGVLSLVAEGSSGPPDSWTLSSQLVTTSGHVPSSAEVSAFLQQHCPHVGQGIGPTRAPDPEAFQACREQVAHAFHTLVTYQPAGRYWAFQWMETGIFVALAILAAAGCYWWVARRTA